MAVRTTFDFDTKEHYRALRAVTRETPFRWLIPLLALVVPGVMIAMVLIGAAARGVPLGRMVPSVLPYVALSLFWFALVPLSQRRRANRLPSEDVSTQGPQVRTLDSEGFHSSGNGVKLDVPWHAFKRAVETEEFFLMFYNRQCAYFLPKRTMSVGEQAEIRDLLRTGLGDRARTADL